MRNNEKFRSMVSAFRMSELQALMVFAGKSKAGKKSDLQSRALALVKLNSSDINLKIQDLSKNMADPGNEASTSSTSTYSNPYTDPIPQSPPPASRLVYPTFPDVSLKKLPFYKLEETLLKPSSLQPNGNGRFQEQNFEFHLTPGQCSDISNSSYRNDLGRPDYRTQILMRFSLLETSCEQEDNFPSSICVKVNQKLCPLPNPIPTNKPGAEPKRPPRPINITALCKLTATSANNINVSWAVEMGKGHTVSFYLVESLSYMDLFNQLKAKGLRQPDYTVALIKEKLADKDQEIATTSCKVSLACPLGKMRMNAPCRASTCDHLQCFDAQLYLQMNEKKPKWICPVCNKPAQVKDLLIDGFFMELIKSPRLPADEHEIVLHNDGTWDPLETRQEEFAPIAAPGPSGSQQVDTFALVDSDSDEAGEEQTEQSESVIGSGSGKARTRESGLLDSGEEEGDFVITLDSDSEDEEPVSLSLPPKKRRIEPVNSPSSPELICLDDD